MAGTISNFSELELLDHVLKTGAYIVPTNIYVALWTGDPLDTGAGVAEVSGGSYARVVMNSWDAATARATENSGLITFPQATANWGTVTHFAIFDAITGGNFLAHGDLAVSKQVDTGGNVYFSAGDIDISFPTGGACDNLANKLLDHIFKTTEYTPETNLYVALFTANPTDTGVAGTEVSGGGYARKLHNVYDAAVAGATENTGAITFNTATASWGTIAFMMIMNDLTGVAGANCLIYSALGASKLIGTDDVVELADGALDITLD